MASAVPVPAVSVLRCAVVRAASRGLPAALLLTVRGAVTAAMVMTEAGVRIALLLLGLAVVVAGFGLGRGLVCRRRTDGRLILGR